MTKRTTVEEITEGGRGAYEFSYDGIAIYTLPNGRQFVRQDSWCGGSVEGQCYRAHYAELTPAEAEKIKADPDTLNRMDLAWKRQDLPVWLARAIKAAVSVAA